MDKVGDENEGGQQTPFFFFYLFFIFFSIFRRSFQMLLNWIR